MKAIQKLFTYFSKTEILLWTTSVLLIAVSFVLFDSSNVITLIASLLGVTSIIINAKGNPLGQLLMIVFSLLYGYISFTFSYFGEMVTYLGMTMPMSVFSLIAWLRHPYQGKKSEVEINRITVRETAGLLVLSAAVTVLFFFVLKYFHTANLYPSTLSVTTSFIAVYLTFRRNPYFSVAYAANDVVLIVLWVLAAIENPKYTSVVVCFVAFFLNDCYGFIHWKAMEQRQRVNDAQLSGERAKQP